MLDDIPHRTSHESIFLPTPFPQNNHMDRSRISHPNRTRHARFSPIRNDRRESNMRSPRSGQNLVVLDAVCLHRKDGLRSRRLLDLCAGIRTARAREAGRTAAVVVVARGFRVDENAVPAA